MALNDLPFEFTRLTTAVERSHESMKDFRAVRKEALDAYKTCRYMGDTTMDETPINLVELAVNIILRRLVSRNPRTLIETPVGQLKPMAADFEQAVNEAIMEIELGDTLLTAAFDAFFSMGIVKLAVEYHGSVSYGGQEIDLLIPYADAIDYDDFVYDTSANTLDEADYYGNYYAIPLEEAQESDLYDKDAREMLMASERRMALGGGEVEDASRLRNGAGVSQESELRDYVHVWDIYLPSENMMVTFPAMQGGASNDDEHKPLLPLRVEEWGGPDTGPYHFLRLRPIPREIMPKAPVVSMLPIHEVVNSLYRKLNRQAERQKEIDYAMLGEDGQRTARLTKEANDGDIVPTHNPASVKKSRFGGPDQPTLAMAIHLVNTFKMDQGNLDSLGGLTASAETLGQERLLAASASGLITDYQDTMYKFTQGIVRDLAWYEWTEPIRRRRLKKTIPGTDLSAHVDWTPELRRGDFLDYNFNVEPYSLQERSHGEQLNTLVGLFQTIIMPALPMMTQQGILFKWSDFLRRVGELSHTDMTDFLIYGEPPDEGGLQSRDTQRQSPVTTRENVRINKPGGTQQGRDSDFVNRLMAGGQGGAEGGLVQAVG